MPVETQRQWAKDIQKIEYVIPSLFLTPEIGVSYGSNIVEISSKIGVNTS